jgi:hypothetical protein
MVEAELAAMRNRTFLDMFYFGCTFENVGVPFSYAEGIFPKSQYGDYLRDLKGAQSANFCIAKVSIHTWPNLSK